MSDILHYYQGKKWKDEPGRATKLYYKTTHRETTNKQVEYHKALVAFLKSKGYNPNIYDRPKDKADCRAKISGMLTVLRKNGWSDEFFGKGEGAKDNAES